MSVHPSPGSSSVNGGLEDGSTSAQDLRERAVKELGITSSAFIGPAFPPARTTPGKPDIEDKVSEFYDELAKMSADGVDASEEQVWTSGQQKTHSQSRLNTVSGNGMKAEEVDGCRIKVQHRQGSWPHWYQNEQCNTSPRPNVDCEQQWQNFPAQSRVPEPGRNLHHSAFPHPASSTSQGFLRGPPSNVNIRGYSTYPRNEEHPEVRPSELDWSISGDPPPHRPQPGVWRQRHEPEYEQWERQHHSRPPEDLHTLILMRGLPGSGKSTLARELLSSKPRGVILSTDDYFAQKHGYAYDRNLIADAHEWNQRRAKDAMHDGCSPIIIDNTNVEAWEMKPYVRMALERGYRVDFCEPDTKWKFDPSELERRNTHQVPRDKISHMLRRFSVPISVSLVLNSEEPPHVRARKSPKSPHQRRSGQPHRTPTPRSGSTHKRKSSEFPDWGPLNKHSPREFLPQTSPNEDPPRSERQQMRT